LISAVLTVVDYTGRECTVQSETTDRFRLLKAVRQRYLIYPISFNCYSNRWCASP